MTVLPALACMLLAAAALVAGFALASRRGTLGPLVRSLAIGGALALGPSVLAPGSRPFAVLGVAAALLPRPLALLAGAAGAAAIGLGAVAATPWAPCVVAVAVVAAAAALWDATEARLSAGADAAGPAAAGGAALAIAVIAAAGGRALAFGFALGPPEGRIVLPEAGLLFGLALLAALGGALVLGAHLACGTTPGLARVTGQRALLLASGFALLGLGFAVARGLGARPDALATGARGLAVCLGALGVLVLGLMLLLGRSPASDVAALQARSAAVLRGASTLAVLSALAAAGEGYWRHGTYATPAFAATLVAALLGLAASAGTRLGSLLTALFLAGLLSALA